MEQGRKMLTQPSSREFRIDFYAWLNKAMRYRGKNERSFDVKKTRV